MLNKDQFQEAFNFYYDSICRDLLLFTTDFDLIEDVVQNIFIKLWEERENYKVDTLKTFLFVSSRNRLFNELRNSKNRERLLSDFYVDEATFEKSKEIIDQTEFNAYLSRAVAKLTPRVQEVYKLSREKGFTYRQIASVLNISINTVENHMGQALLQITTSLKESYSRNTKA